MSRHRRAISRPSERPRQQKGGAVAVVATCLALGLGLLTPLGCALERRPFRESQSFKELWGRYDELPAYRAMAVAGRLESERWVAGVVAGLPTTEAAEQRALIECRKKRRTARMSSLCRLYAIGPLRVSEIEAAEAR